MSPNDPRQYDPGEHEDEESKDRGSEDSGVEHPTEGDSNLARLLGEYADKLAEREAGDPVPPAAAEDGPHPDLDSEVDALKEIRSLITQSSPPPRLGPYKLIRLLGHGAMGDVFLAWQEALGRPVALKVLAHKLLEDETARKRFEREARVAAGLHHPSIVPVFDLGIDAGWPYYAMELIEGETLREIQDRVRRSDTGNLLILPPSELQDRTRTLLWRIASSSGAWGGNTPGSGVPMLPSTPLEPSTGQGSYAGEEPLQADEALPDKPSGDDPSSPDVPHDPGAGSRTQDDSTQSDAKSDFYTWMAVTMADVAEGLNYAHNHKVLHRDVKPSNLMLDENGRCRILDFGLAWVEDDLHLTRSGHFVGTIPFMSPEQAQEGHDALTAGTDIYSLGATIYYVLAGQPVFQGSSYKETLDQIHHDDPAPLRKVNGHVPRDIETIVMKCLRKSPRDRYLTAEALAQDLRRYARGEPIEARPVPPWLRVLDRLWRRRAKVLQAAALLVIVGAVALMVSGAVRARAREHLRRYGSLLCQAEAFRLEPRPTHASLGFGPLAELPPDTPAVRPMPKVEPENSCFVIPWYADTGPLVADTVDSPAHDALELLREAEELRPEDPRTACGLALTCLSLGLDDQARAHAEEAIRLDSGSRETIALQRLIDSRSNQGLSGNLQPDLDPDTERWVDAWVRAQGAVLDGEWEKAADEFQHLVSLTEEAERTKPSHLGNLLGRAVSLFQAGKPASAIGTLGVVRILWKSYDDNPIEPDLLTARVYLQTEPDSAKAQFESLFERMADVDKEVRELTALRIAEIYQQQRDYVTALEWVDRIEPKGAAAFRKRAELLYLSAALVEALAAARKAVELDGNREDAASRIVLSSILRSLGDLKGALNACFDALEIAPDDPRCLVARGLVLEDAGNSPEALWDYRRAARTSPWYSAAHFHLGRLIEDSGDEARAEKRFKEALRRNPRDALAAHDLGMLYLQQERLTDAEELFSRAITCDPGLASAHYNRAWLLFLANRCDEAVTAYERAIECGLDNPVVQNNLGAAKHSLCDFSYAIPHFKQAIDRKSDLLAAQLNLANALLKIFGAGEAIPHHEKAVGMATDSTDAHFLLGVASGFLHVKEARERALDSYRQAVRLDPGNGYALRELVKVLRNHPEQIPEGEALAHDIRLLEDSLTSPGAGPEVRDFLIKLRERYLPRLASLASVDWYLDRNTRSLIGDEAVWEFFKGEEPPSKQLEWTKLQFPADPEDGWEKAPGGFGMGEDARQVIRTYLSDMQGQYSSVYLRHRFTVASPGGRRQMLLKVCCDDGFVAYLNGKEIARINVGSGHEFSPRHAPDIPVNALLIEVPISPNDCREGENVLAIHALNRSIDDQDFCIWAGLEAFPLPERDRDLEALETFRRDSAAPRDRAVEHYMEARILERSGDHTAALAAYRKLLTEAPTRGEPVLRMADCLVALERPEDALEPIREAALEGKEPRHAVWDRWWRLSAVELEQDLEKVLSEFPALPGQEPCWPAEDLHWALERLSRDGAIRINCGGPDYRHQGRLWGRDRFHRGGWPYTGYRPAPHEIAGTSSDPLYQTEHIWEGGQRLGGVTYSIPVVPGHYLLTLHFAELWHYADGERCFDVLVEGRPLRHSLDPLKEAGGRATALVLGSFDIEVKDGSLDIRLREIRGHAQICALEILRR